MANSTTFGSWLKQRRRLLDLTQKELAEQIGCSLATIRKIEKDDRRPSKQLAELMAETLDVPTEHQQAFITFARTEPYTAENGLALVAISSAQSQALDIPTAVSPASVQKSQNDLQPEHLLHNLPSQTTPFIGREGEINQILAFLDDPGQRLITILGPGGMGKTRLALAVGEQLVSARDDAQIVPTDGVFFIPLASIEEPENMVQHIATALAIHLESGGDLKQQLIARVRRKNCMLLMDNCEHLLDGVDLFAEILQAAPQVQIVATSRERLMLQGEQLLTLGGLEVPFERLESGELNAEAYTAVQLFQQCAQRIQPTFSVTEDTLQSVSQICQLVAGMPLGIELAAGWLDIMPVGEIKAEIQKSVDFLESDLRNLPERQRSIRAVFEGSWHKLNQDEQSVFSSISVFRGGFTREAANQVANASIRHLSRLQAKSMLQFDQEKNRFQVHELLRQFGVEKLAEDNERETAVRTKHAQFYCHFLSEREFALKSEDVLTATYEIDHEIDNIRRAWSWASEHHLISNLWDALESLGWFYHWPARHKEGFESFHLASRHIENSIADPSSTTQTKILYAYLLSWQAFHYSRHSFSTNEVKSWCDMALSTLNALDEKNGDILRVKAHIYRVLSEISGVSITKEYTDYIEKSLDYYRELDDRWTMGEILTNYSGRFAYNDFQAAYEKIVLAEQLLKGFNHPFLNYWVANLKKRSYLHLGEIEEAQKLVKQDVSQALGDFSPSIKISNIFSKVTFHIWSGQFEQSLKFLGDLKQAANHFERLKSLGEIMSGNLCHVYIHLGETQKAIQEAQHCITLSEQEGNLGFLGWGQYLLGKIQMTSGNLVEAESLCLECSHSPDIDDQTRYFSKAALGYIWFRQNLIEKAYDQLSQTLDFGLRHHLFFNVLTGIPVLALIQAENGNVTRAITLYSLASNYDYVNNSSWFAHLYGTPIAKLAESLPAEEVDAAKENGRSLDFWETAEMLLAELEKGKV